MFYLASIFPIILFIYAIKKLLCNSQTITIHEGAIVTGKVKQTMTNQLTGKQKITILKNQEITTDIVQN